jgi:hypothetical protein
VVRSPIDGVIFAPPEKKDNKTLEAQGQLQGWTGNPFHPSNKGLVFSDGELLCVVAPRNEMEGELLVDQYDRNLLQQGDLVEIMFDSAKLKSFMERSLAFRSLV